MPRILVCAYLSGAVEMHPEGIPLIPDLPVSRLGLGDPAQLMDSPSEYFRVLHDNLGKQNPSDWLDFRDASGYRKVTRAHDSVSRGITAIMHNIQPASIP